VSAPRSTAGPYSPPATGSAGVGCGSLLAVFVVVFTLNALVNFLLARWSRELAIGLAELLAVGLPTVLAVRFLRLEARRLLRWRRAATTDLLLALPLAASLSLLNDQLSNLTGLVFPMPRAVHDAIVDLLRASTGLEWAVRIFGVGVAAAVSEELLFRGLIQGSLEKTMGPRRAIVLTSLAFAVIHMLPWGFPSYFLAGLALGLATVATSSLAVPILVHFLNNLTALALVNLTGVETLGRPVWVPLPLLLPALLVFALVMRHYLQRLSRAATGVPPSPLR
jgi:membrane protease YdiL (CAAX protease family)